jgi:hypothetical protein
MYQFNSKYSYGLSNSFDSKNPKNVLKMGVVTSVGKVTVSKVDEISQNRDINFNADEHSIRCRIIGSDYDNGVSDSDLANCFPLLPKHINLVPKVGEVVMIITMSETDKYSDRFYIGPITSSLTKLKFDTIDGTALSNFGVGISKPSAELSKIVTANGVYENPQNLTIQGRENTDIIQRPNEIILRSGKFVLNKPDVFNSKNPGYIQLKFNQDYLDGDVTKNGSVTSIVANKINLLTYDGSKKLSDLTYVDKTTNIAEYLSDDTMERLLQESHPIVFGDLLVEYLKLLKNALLNHVHNGNGNKATDRTDGSGLPIDEFIKKSEILEKSMLSKNIRTN